MTAIFGQHGSRRRLLIPFLIVAGTPWILATSGAAQPGAGPAAVGVTEARSLELRAEVRLTGVVAARTSALVASEVAGVVQSMEAREGQKVRRGAALVHLRGDQLQRQAEAAKARLAEAEARLAQADGSLTRARELFASGVLSQQGLDDAQSESGAWQGRADQARAEIAGLELQLQRTVVRAPFVGVVVREHTEVGEWVAAGGPVLELVSTEELEIVVSVPERYFAQTRPGLTARVTIDALPGSPLQGKVSAVIPQADSQARAFPVKVALLQPSEHIGVGMSATVAFASGEMTPAVVVPKDAVVSTGSQPVVYRVEEGDGGAEVAQPVVVQPGQGVGEWVAVNGVASGDRVVTRGNERLFPGTPVAVEPVEYADP